MDQPIILLPDGVSYRENAVVPLKDVDHRLLLPLELRLHTTVELGQYLSEYLVRLGREHLKAKMWGNLVKHTLNCL